METGTMRLRQGRRAKRLGRKPGKELADRPLKIMLDAGRDVVQRFHRYFILQTG